VRAPDDRAQAREGALGHGRASWGAGERPPAPGAAGVRVRGVAARKGFLTNGRRSKSPVQPSGGPPRLTASVRRRRRGETRGQGGGRVDDTSSRRRRREREQKKGGGGEWGGRCFPL